MKLSEKQEISCHRRGLIPGPSETEDAFARRVNSACRKTTHSILFFDLQPDWVPVYTDAKLPFWEGASTWIEEEKGERRCTIQIKPIHSCLYTQEEILSHELVHATRLCFDETRFEEILAFCTSKNPLRRYLGPLFSRRCESVGFLVLLAVSWIGYSLDLFFAEGDLGIYALTLPFLGLSVCALRLARSQYLFSQTLKAMQSLIQNPEQALSAMLYLTDPEIELFAKLSCDKIQSYLASESLRSIRMTQFVLNFLSS